MHTVPNQTAGICAGSQGLLLGTHGSKDLVIMEALSVHVVLLSITIEDLNKL